MRPLITYLKLPFIIITILLISVLAITLLWYNLSETTSASEQNLTDNKMIDFYNPHKVFGNVKLMDMGGKITALSDYRPEKLLINIWASWCAPCLDEMPSLSRFAGRKHDFRIIALNIDNDQPANIIKFLDKMQIKNLEILFDRDAALFSTIGAFALPISLMIDDRGKICAMLTGPIDWESSASVPITNSCSKN